MPSTAEQVKSIVSKYNGRARKQQIARELNMGLDYVDLVCRDLEGKGEITFRDGFYFLATSKNNSHQKNRTNPRRGKQEKFTSNIIYTEPVLSDIPKMTKGLKDVLEGAGYKTIESLADAPIARLMQETKLELHEAAGLINQARKALNKI